MTTDKPRPHYRAPSWFDRRLMNPAIEGLTRLGLSFWGSRVLEVRGRKTGEPRRVPVNPVTYDGVRYLVAPRGQTQWVRNLRATREGSLLLGSPRSTLHVIAPIESNAYSVSKNRSLKALWYQGGLPPSYSAAISTFWWRLIMSRSVGSGSPGFNA